MTEPDMFVFSFQIPTILIAIDVEATRPRIATTARNEAELERLIDWIRSQPTLHAWLQAGYALARGDELVIVDARDDTQEGP